MEFIYILVCKNKYKLWILFLNRGLCYIFCINLKYQNFKILLLQIKFDTTGINIFYSILFNVNERTINKIFGI